MEEQVQHALGFNSIPLWTGLEALLADKATPAATLVALVREDAKRQELPATADAARDDLGKVVGLLRKHLPTRPEGEGVVSFSIDDVYNPRDPAGELERLRCSDVVGVGTERFAVLVPEHASEDKGPFTGYRYRAVLGQPLSYERVTDAGVVARVLEAARS